MTHSHTRKSSRIPWFRMDVPKDIRHLVGKTSWQRSLETTDPTLADTRRAHYSAHYKGEIIRHRAMLAQQAAEDADRLVARAFDKLAAYHGSMDVAVATQLNMVAMIVRASWSVDHAHAVEMQHFGEEQTSEWHPRPEPIPSIDDDEERRLFRLRAELFEGNGAVNGIVYQDLARSLLARGIFEPLHFAVSYLPYVVREIDISSRQKYDEVARAYLTRLAEHEFVSWPQGIREALLPIAQPERALAEPQHALEEQTLAAAFELWKAKKKIQGEDKTADEWEKAIRRFEELCGTGDVRAVSRKMVERFAGLVGQLPSRPRKEVASLPLLTQIEFAARDNLPTLAPPSVGKDLAGIKALLGIAVREEWIATNPASGVTVDGARWEGIERDHFSDDDMRRIYTSPLMTDPDACDDTMFWILFLAPFHGSRPGEHCKLKPNEIVRDDGEWVMRIRADRRRRVPASDAPASRPRRTKTIKSVRDIPLHWIVLEAGFLDFVAFQRERGAEWVFDDLQPDKYGDRYKYLSRKINDALRALGIDDPDKAFYSTRHTMKREGRRRRIDPQSLDQISGHANGHVGSKYGQGIPTETLKSDIDRLEFRSVPWDAVVDCARQRTARLADRA